MPALNRLSVMWNCYCYHGFVNETKVNLYTTLRPDGYNLGLNVGPVGAQEIPHVHLHVIPRFRGEPLAGRGISSHLEQPARKRP